MLLLAASCVFYMVFVPSYILILFFTIVVDYFAGIQIEKAQGAKRKTYLVLSLVANIGVLAIFKYGGFATENLNLLLNFFGYTKGIPFLQMVLPIGLSFHTFQAMSYTIEVYRGNERAEKDFSIYALYVMFYPQLVAGPIERPQNLLHQFREVHQFDYAKVVSGLRLMFWGFLKKLLIADRIAVAVGAAYSHPADINGPALLIVIYFFSIQIYCDFSAYSDIARGAARVMGFELMKNFDQPYFSSSLPEFWRRWHISLSTWFKDYVYLPLGGNRTSTSRWYFNLLFVFAISGLWHGANWTFIVWGVLHGSALVGYYATADLRAQLAERLNLNRFPKLMNGLAQFITFNYVSFAWIFFRANSLSDALVVIKNIFNWQGSLSLSHLSLTGLNYYELLLSFTIVATLLLLERQEEKKNISLQFDLIPVWQRWISYYAAFFLLLFLGKFTAQQFIYFQF